MREVSILRNGEKDVKIIKFSKSFYPDKIIKVYFSGREIEKKIELLEEINNKDYPLRSSIPENRILKREGDRIYIEEEFIKGIPMELDAKRVFKWKRYFVKNLELARVWITKLHKEFVFEDRIVKKSSIEKYIEEVNKCMNLDFFENIEIRDYHFPYILLHGDYRPSNIIKKNNKIFIIDWEKWNKRGIYLFDLMEFILRYIHSHHMWQRKGIYLEETVFLEYWKIIYLNKNFLTQNIKKNIDFYCNEIGIGDNEKKILLVLWLHKNLYPYQKKEYLL